MNISLQVYENMGKMYTAFFDTPGRPAAGSPLQLRSTSSFKILGETPLQGACLLASSFICTQEPVLQLSMDKHWGTHGLLLEASPQHAHTARSTSMQS